MVNVLGPRDEFLQILERELDAGIHVRGNEITLTGSPVAVELAVDVITELVTVLRTGQGLTADAVERIVGMLATREDARPADVLTHNILSSRGRTIRFLHDGTREELKKIIETLGETPLPKYIKRKPEEEDKERYQTVFAKHEGAVAAPTAGMHFSRELLKRLDPNFLDDVLDFAFQASIAPGRGKDARRIFLD